MYHMVPNYLPELAPFQISDADVDVYSSRFGVTTIYMGITLYAPALALQSVANLPLWLSIIIAGSVGIIYTVIGGIKSVIWTDAFQCFIIFGGTIAILIKGLLEVGSSDTFGRILQDGKRLHFNFDPRVRHTFWGLLIGAFFTWLPNWCNQSSIQRISSLKTGSAAKSAFLISIPFSVAYGGLMGTLGLVLYAYYNLKECDPLEAGYINNSNQLMPYFVFDVMRPYPSLPGIYISALFSGSLSTVSSGINSLAANTVEDLLKNKLVNLSNFQVTLVAKLAVVIFGGLAIGVAYVAQSVPGPVTQISLATFGACGGPVAGLFFLGAMFPFANWMGAFVGGFLSITINLWISVGATLYGQKAMTLEPNPTTGCDAMNMLNSTLNNISSASSRFSLSSFTDITTRMSVNSTFEGTNSPSDGFFMYNISYIWYGFIGFVLTIVIGIIVSCVTGNDKHHKTEPKYLFTFCRRLLKNDEEEHYVGNQKHPAELLNFEILTEKGLNIYINTDTRKSGESEKKH